ncbi:uncharacterized protein FOMMEDRAFT_167196 [Fomitiporia mediterranea MF3/22]|uniref:uncharacterized protein n=1 Tax=Fomitiporia mediterranea (strain MF3/22) TaxID=694068 RepID=UPI0004409122|nr:uncharacterized protein FOMMEDRAFT_167196 [Fomitiporia mediterranea MF3/22]EJD03888.1 hypothetical protein FOMMEDRAFT_167196 [Fomitiporia mediterranea MF3/22]
MSKKKRRTLQDAAVHTEEVPGRDLISILPWELIAEILSTTTSNEVLAMARCSQHFCHSLVTVPRSKAIWIKARNNCSLPDPTPNFTEPSYAAFVFGGGLCSQCGKFSANFYSSFSLRLRFCNDYCAENWRKTSSIIPDMNEDTEAIAQWLLCSEKGRLSDRDATFFESIVGFIRRPFYQTLEFDKALEEYKEFVNLSGSMPQDRRQLYISLHEKRTKQKKATMNLCSLLVAWRRDRIQKAQALLHKNRKTLEKLAIQEGWNIDDLVNTPTYQNTLRHYDRALRRFREEDFNLIRTDVEAEVTKIVEKRSRSEEEQAYARRRELVALDYHRRKSANSASSNAAALPTQNVFRELAVIKAIQNKQGSKPEDVIKKFGDDAVKQLIEEALSSWRDQTTKIFVNILGMKGYNAISTKKLHPVDRLTARFLCTKCLGHTSDRRKVPLLDFKMACSHQCSHLTKQQKGKAKWSPEQFELDHQASKVTRKLLTLLSVSEDDRSSLTAVAKIGDRILCKTCDGQITMNFCVLQRHSHRHDNMEIEILSPTQANERAFLPIQWDLCSSLTSRAKSAFRKAGLRKYGCRHCLLYEAPAQSEPTTGQNEANSDTEIHSRLPNTRSKQRKLMTFNGMQCHLLQAHRVSVVDDEDVYRADDLEC